MRIAEGGCMGLTRSGRAPLATLALLMCCLAGATGPQSALAQGGAAATGNCAPQGNLHFVCNLISVEDFVPVSGGRWLVGGSYVEKGVGLYLVDTRAKTAKPVALSPAAKPDPLYAGCSAPDLTALQTHGVDVLQAHGHITVYAINHGGRESVEIFRLHPAAGTAEWVGCALPPEGVSGNAVAAMGQGAFVMTKFDDTRDKQGFQHIMSGQVTGAVYRFTPGKGFDEVPGTQLAGDNGLVVSSDRQWIYVNAYGTREIYRLPLSGNGARQSVKVDFCPDNLRWAPDGSLFVTGQFIDAKSMAITALHGWATVRLDPQTMAITPVVKEPGLKVFDNATSTVQVGQTLWFGTFRGDRMAYMRVPNKQ